MAQRFGRSWFLRMAWRHGGKAERGAVAIIAAAPAVVGLALVVFWIYALLGGLGEGEVVFASLSMIVAALTWFLYQPAVQRPLNGAGVLRGILQTGVVSASEADYLSELARYKETCGVEGQIPGDVKWSYVYGFIYFVSLLGAGAIPVEFYSSFGLAAPLSLVISVTWLAIVCWLVYLRRIKREIREAERRGYRLRVLRTKVIASERRIEPPH